jgi:hypothetical protein
MSPEEAFALADAELMKISERCDIPLVLYRELAVEVDEGWAFFYDSREFFETGNVSSTLVGNCPIFIDRGGSVHYLPTSMPWKEGLDKLRRSST